MPDVTPLSLMALQMDSLYRYDTAGLMLGTNEPDGTPPPRFAMHRTLHGHTWRFSYTLPMALQQQIAKLCAAEPLPADLQEPPAMYHAIRAVLAEAAPITHEYRGPAFALTQIPKPPRHAVLITPANQQLLQRFFPEEHYPPEAGPVAVAVADGAAVARCYCSRLTPHVAHAGLETVAAYRKQGHATNAVATWAAAVYASGRLPLYGTTWDNLVSQRIAHHVAGMLFGEDWSID